MSKKIERLLNIIILLLVYIGGIFLISFILNYNSDKDTHIIATAKGKLPIIRIKTYADREYNYLYGYTNEMNISYIHGDLCIIGNRSDHLKISISDCKDDIRLDYEITNCDKSRVYLNGELESMNYENGVIIAKIPLRGIVDTTDEMMLHLTIHNNDNLIHYYARLKSGSRRLAQEYIDFVNNFIKGCIDKKMEIAQFIEPLGTMDDKDLGYTNVNSSYENITFLNIEPKMVQSPVICISEMSDDVAILKSNYILGFFDDNQNYKLLNVYENYRVRRGEKRVILLNFERKISEEFKVDDNIFAKSKLSLGITSSDFDYMATEMGNNVCLKKNRKLFSYNNSSGSVNQIYVPDNLKNGRYNIDNYDIKILNIDDAGSVNFIVYGYIGYGSHQGMNGLILYKFDAALNCVVERLVVNCDREFKFIKKDLEKLSYMSNNNHNFYFLMNDKVYMVDLLDGKDKVILKDAKELNLSVSKNGKYMAYGNEKIKKDDISNISNMPFKEIITYDLDNNQKYEIKADNCDAIDVLGFLYEDLIYGCVNLSDVGYDVYGETLIPAHKIRISSIMGKDKKEYDTKKNRVSKVVIDNKNIELYRVRKKKFNKNIYENIKQDRIIYSHNGKPSIVSIVKEVKDISNKISYIIFPNRIPNNEHRTFNPLFVAENNRGLIDVVSDKKVDRHLYYVFVNSNIEYMDKNLVSAIKYASLQAGVVVDNVKGTIWQRTSYNDSYLIDYDSIDEKFYNLNNLKNEDALVLNGCDMEDVLYFVKCGKMVIADTQEGKILIVGYDRYNLILRNYDKIGNLKDEYYYGKNDSKELFMKNKNKFICF